CGGAPLPCLATNALGCYPFAGRETEGVMDRRALLGGALGVSVLAATGGAAARESSFDDLLAELESDPELVENAWTRRERQATRSVGQGTPSSRLISSRASDMIVRLEVSSQRRYERYYTRP